MKCSAWRRAADAGNLDALAEVADSPRYHFEKVDLCHGDAVHGVFSRYRPDAVIHLAAETHVDRAIDAFTKIGRKYEILGKTREDIIAKYGE